MLLTELLEEERHRGSSLTHKLASIGGTVSCGARSRALEKTGDRRKQEHPAAKAWWLLIIVYLTYIKRW